MIVATPAPLRSPRKITSAPDESVRLPSRVARSNIYLLNMLGAEVRVIAPPTLMPKNIESLGVKAFTDMNKGLEGSDIVMMLRLQTERMQGSYVPSTREYYEFYGLDYKKITKAHPNALIMHPPIVTGKQIGRAHV